MAKENTPAPGKREGVECLLGGDSDVHSITRVRVQFLNRLGIPFHHAAIIARLAFGEVS